MKDYIGIKCPRCGTQLDLLVEVRCVKMGDTRTTLSTTPAVYVDWKTSVIPHDCEKPNDTGQSSVMEAD